MPTIFQAVSPRLLAGSILAFWATAAAAHPDHDAHEHAANDPNQFLGGHDDPLLMALMIVIAVVSLALLVRLIRARGRAE